MLGLLYFQNVLTVLLCCVRKGKDDWLLPLCGIKANLCNDLKMPSFQTPFVFFRIYAEQVYDIEHDGWKTKLAESVKSSCLCCGANRCQQGLKCPHCTRPLHSKCAMFLKTHEKECVRVLCDHKAEEKQERCDTCCGLVCHNCIDEHTKACFAFCVERMDVSEERASACFVCRGSATKDKHLKRVTCVATGCKRWKHAVCADTKEKGWAEHLRTCGQFTCSNSKEKHDESMTKVCIFCERRICVQCGFEKHEKQCFEQVQQDVQAGTTQLPVISEDGDDDELTQK